MEREKTADALTMNTKCTCEFKLVYLRRSLIKSKKRFDLPKKKQQRMQQFCIVTLSKKKKEKQTTRSRGKARERMGKMEKMQPQRKTSRKLF